ncbi:coordinator of PRMT5 and differentiation stimulator isoform X2 [Microcaecilia unicolor]|nr:coordinator of PRMT5 and differentiation stimulator isoform X2 [Microcaecilia unicolor]
MMWKPQREYLQKKVQSHSDGSFCWPERAASLTGNVESAGDATDSDASSETSFAEDYDEGMDKYNEADVDDLDVEFEACDPANAFIPEVRMDMEYEKEDWDKELNADDPYDFEDIDPDFQPKGLVASSVEQQENSSMYLPSLHHAAPLITTVAIVACETGQFDDVDS